MTHLENLNMMDNTYIIFTSDHGLSVGQHGLLGKQSLYEHSIRVPMIIYGPDIEANSIYNHDIYLQDIFPTTLDLANIKIPNSIDFKSFKDVIINKKNKKIHDAIYGTYSCCQSDFNDYQRMIRKDDHKLILFPKNKRMELYDLKNDPYEISNLAYKKQNSQLVKNLFDDLILLQQKMQDTLDLKRIFN
jgi:arylsulfatase A-like enzyme